MQFVKAFSKMHLGKEVIFYQVIHCHLKLIKNLEYLQKILKKRKNQFTQKEEFLKLKGFKKQTS